MKNGNLKLMAAPQLCKYFCKALSDVRINMLSCILSAEVTQQGDFVITHLNTFLVLIKVFV